MVDCTVLGANTMVLKTTENAVIGVNDHTLVTEADGRRWVTREPAIVYFHKKYWFNIIAMIRDNGIFLLLQFSQSICFGPRSAKIY